MVSQRTGEVGSLGRIMGNRSTLYKYLNPNVFLLTTISETKSSASLYLIDAVSGNTVWYTRHVGEVETSGGIQATLTENWLVYAFQGKYAPGKASRVVSVELYEDWEPKHLDPKGKAKKKVKYQGGKCVENHYFGRDDLSATDSLLQEHEQLRLEGLPSVRIALLHCSVLYQEHVH